MSEKLFEKLHFFLMHCIFLQGLVVLFLVSCKNDPPQTFPHPASYDLNKPVLYKLPPELDEISGLYYYARDKSLFAIHDERGWLYKITPGEKLTIQKWKYTGGADFEDIVLVDSTFYSLKSNGTIVTFKFLKSDSVSEHTFHLPKKPRKEFESLYYDSTRQQLIMICKDCEADKKNTASAFAFDPVQNKYVDSPVYIIEVNKIEKAVGGKIPKFKPSAAGINPVTGELYIIASVNKLLVIADTDGKVKDAFPLNPKLFKQPEGLAFSSQGDLFISNEAADVGAANILLFKYRETAQQ